MMKAVMCISTTKTQVLHHTHPSSIVTDSWLLYCVGETTWDSPALQEESPPPTPQRKFRSSESNGDMSLLKRLQDDADKKIAALR